MPTEKQLDLALASALENDPAFLDWFVSHTKFAGTGARFRRCRANYVWGTHPFRRTDASGNEVVEARESETDILLLLEDPAGRTVAIHIENKVGTGTFTNDQPAMYPQRAAHWVGNPHYGRYEDFDIVLVAPNAFFERNGAQAAQFPVSIPHEAIGEHVPLFAQSTAAS